MQNQSPDEAIDAWRQAVAMDPHNLEALNSLDRLLRTAGRFPDLVEVLRLKQNVETSKSSSSVSKSRPFTPRSSTIRSRPSPNSNN